MRPRERVAALVERGADPASAPTSDAATAFGVLARALLGENPKTSDAIRKGAEACAARLPARDAAGLSVDVAYWHWGTLAMFQVGGEPWNRWNTAMQSAIDDTQRKDGDACAAKGSWDPVGAGAAEGGRVWATACLATCLEVYYRYDRLFGATPVPVAPAPAAAAPGAAAGNGASDATRESLVLKRRQEATTAPSEARRTRTVSGRTFRLDADGRWVDSAWDGKAAPERVEAYSSAYFDLVAASEDVARILALGDRVLLLVGARVVEVAPPAQAAMPVPK